MEITGSIIQINQIITGLGKKGKWEKQEFVISTDSQYPKTICFSLWGDKIKKFTFKIGDKVKVSFDLESNESKGKYYTEARAWMVQYQKPIIFNSKSEIAQPEPEPIQELPLIIENENYDDLPF